MLRRTSEAADKWPPLLLLLRSGVAAKVLQLLPPPLVLGLLLPLLLSRAVEESLVTRPLKKPACRVGQQHYATAPNTTEPEQLGRKSSQHCIVLQGVETRQQQAQLHYGMLGVGLFAPAEEALSSLAKATLFCQRGP